MMSSNQNNAQSNGAATANGNSNANNNHPAVAANNNASVARNMKNGKSTIFVKENVRAFDTNLALL